MKSTAVLVSMLLVAVVCASLVCAETASVVKLPAPETEGGRPLMQVLKERRSTREIAGDPLPQQELSNLLWAAFGINRPEKGLRTAPSARNWQEIDIYVAMKDGLYRYDAKANALDLVLAQDLREATGRQPFVKEAPVNLVFVADYSRMGDVPKETKDIYAAAHAGFISQNVYLYCASAGLATVVRGSVDKDGLAKAMGLPADRKVVFAQTVGYPKK